MNWSVPRPIITVMASERSEGFAGLQITYRDRVEVDALLRALEGQARAAARADGIPFERDNVFMLGIVMPCGSRFLFRDATSVPHTDIECPCGNPQHWVIRYAEKVQDAAPVPVWP